jgi:2,4-didehydro-3-deoxy-L-rhamnonate hydrolase
VVVTGEHSALDLSGEVSDFTPGFFGAGGLEQLADLLRSGRALPVLDTAGARFGPPLMAPGKIVCIGLNYEDHAREAGMELPSEPTVFFKAPSALCGPTDDLQIPIGGAKTDWEVELAFVVGKRARSVQTPQCRETTSPV